ncbi:MAG: helix-turn-helix transcriptional regulator [Candidatus Paceibacterota bacterium]
MAEIVANQVQEQRSAQGSTQQEVADAVGVSRQTVIAIEKGNYTPSVGLALKLAKYFNSNVETLFFYE